MKKNAKSKRQEAERAAVHYAREILGCTHTVRAIRTMYQRQDLFASDVVGKRPDGTMVFIQATAGGNSAVTARRRKLEDIPWAISDTVQLVQLVQTDDPANSRRKKWFFRVHEYNGKEYGWPLEKRRWETLPDAIEVPREWFKAFKESEE